MSRSRRKIPMTGITTARSDHAWKKKAARKLRHRIKQYLETTLDDDRFTGRRWDVANRWDAPKDGKIWLGMTMISFAANRHTEATASMIFADWR